MSKNEKNYILKNYTINGQANLQFFCSKTKELSIFDKFHNSIAFNRPDMYFLNNRFCYIFEHFEIDASLFIEGKGSSYKRNIFIADKQLEKQANELMSTAPINKNKISSQGTLSITTSQDASKTNLKENFIRIFDSHYENIKEYKENLKKLLSLKSSNFKTIFIIEQTTEFGGFLLKNGKQINLELFYCDFVIEKLKSAINVDYFIFINKSDNEKLFTIIKNGDYEKLNKYILNYDEEKIHFINNITTFTTPIFIPRI